MRSHRSASASAHRLPRPGTIEIAPSILGADFGRLADEMALIDSAGLRMVHLDVMDGHFVPNITIGPPVIAMLRGRSRLVFDVHLMISDPARYMDAVVEAGGDHVTFHIEATREPLELVRRIHALGRTAGISLNPETPVSRIEAVAPQCDMVLVMTVHPGFGGQKFILDAAQKVAEVRALVGPKVRVEVDGGIDRDTTRIVVGYGADTLVAGRAIFGQEDRLAAIDAIQTAAGQIV